MLKQNGETIAQFAIPNPAARTYPQWKLSPFPVVTTTNGLSIALTDFKTQFEGEYGAGEKVPSTICSFKTDEGRVANTNWLARTAEVFDATGNHWADWSGRARDEFSAFTSAIGSSNAEERTARV